MPAHHSWPSSVSPTSQMLMTVAGCSVTRDTLSTSNLRFGVCVPVHAYFIVCVNAFVPIWRRKGSREETRPLLALICVMCANASMYALNLLNWRFGWWCLWIILLVWMAWSDLECDLCLLPLNSPPFPSHNSTATSKAPLTFLLHTHLSIMFIAA